MYDAADVINDSTEAQMEAISRELFAKAGVAIVVVTVPELVDETIEQLAVRIQHDWGVGTKGKDESVVIALSVADRQIFLATGYGSEPYLPDGKVGEIRDHALPALRANDYSRGLLTAVRETAKVAADAHGVKLLGDDSVGQSTTPTARTSEDTGCSDELVSFAIIIVILLLLGGRRRGGRGGRRGGFIVGPWFGWGGGRSWGGGGDDFGGSGGGGGFGGFGGGSGGGGGAGGRF
ncbi:MAG TPA: TPM domain-containing protein [Kofleriaceae bacterium]|nr:TPM domain-containing protein [Kofleriaceae bacterium]